MPLGGRREHSRPGGGHHGERLFVRDVGGGAPRADARVPAGLGPPQVADARDRALVEQRIADRPRRVAPAQPAQEALGVELVGQHVGSERRETPVETRARLGQQLEHGPVELDDLVRRRAQHEPGAPRRPAPPARPLVGAPDARHPQVGVQHEVALEAQEQMLAVGVDGADGAPGEALGPAVHRMAALRGDDLVRHAPLEDRAHAVGGVANGVALGHARRG